MPTYTVQRGDTLAKIAVANNTSVEALARNNNIQDPNLIFVGQTIELPYGERDAPGGDAPAPSRGGEYVVHSGDTLSKIARDNGTTVQEIMRANPGITNPDRIYVGQAIRLPQGGQQSQVPTPQPRPEPPAQGRFNVPAQMAANARAEPGAGGPPIPMAHPGRPATPGPIDYGNWQPIQPENEQARMVRLAQEAGDPMMFSTLTQRPQGQFNIPPQMAQNARMEPPSPPRQLSMEPGYAPQPMAAPPTRLMAGNGTLTFGPGQPNPNDPTAALPGIERLPVAQLDPMAGGSSAFNLATGNWPDPAPTPQMTLELQDRQFDLATTRFIRSLTGPQWGM